MQSINEEYQINEGTNSKKIETPLPDGIKKHQVTKMLTTKPAFRQSK